MNRYWKTHPQRGFSLMELLIVIIIVGVLAAIGLPAYQDYSRKSKRSDAVAMLTQMAQQQERYFSDNSRYATVISQLGYTAVPPWTPSIGGYWRVRIVNGGATFQLEAVPAATHTDGDCQTITLNSAGVRASTPAGQDCWSGR